MRIRTQDSKVGYPATVRIGTPPQTAAVLFTDLVGSTELSSRIGEAAYDDIRRNHFGTLLRAVDEAGGQQVKGTGDGILAVFGSAAAAIECSVAMQQAVDLGARHAVPLEVRVGVALGDVCFEDSDVYGTAVTEAARLVSAARGGQILTTALVRAVAGSRCTAAFTEVGTLELKGLPEPVAAYEVSWDPLPTPSVPLPPLLDRSGRIFVGREEEWRDLMRFWDQARAGTLRAVVIAGEPGVGKSRLAAEFAGRLHARGVTVLAGRCDEDLGVPYQPFVEALRHLAGGATVQPLTRLLGRHGGELSRLVPEFADLVPGMPGPLRSDPDTERFRLFDAVGGWLAAMSGEAPVLLVLEDLQWAAKPTLLLLRHVLSSSAPMRLLVLATYRDTEVGRSHPLSELLVDLRRLETVTRISLSGLAHPAVAALFERAAGRRLGDTREELTRVVHRETEGNPLFVMEVARHLIETGAFRESKGRWTTTLPVEKLSIPEGVRDVIRRRLSRLDKATNRALAVAAVTGEEFEPAVVERAASLDEETVLSALDEAVTARLVTEVVGRVPRYRFEHALVRTTLYGDLTVARRVVLHRHVAEAIESLHAANLDDFLPALAHHYARASAPQVEMAKAVSYAQRAGDRALAQLANDEAGAYYTQALEILGLVEGGVAGAQRLELLISLGEAQRRAGDGAHKDTLLRAAQLAHERGDAGALARAALANNRGFFSETSKVDTERLGVLEAAVQAAAPDDSGTRARLLANLAGELMFSVDNERRNRLADEALALARSGGDPRTLGHVLAHRVPLLVHTELEGLVACVDELGSVAYSLQDPVLIFMATWWGAISSLTGGDLREAELRLGAATQLAEDLKQPFYRWATGFVRSNLCRVDGQLTLAERHALDTYEIGRSAGIPDASRVQAINIFWIRHEQGGLGQLVDRLFRAAAKKDADPLTLALLTIALCELDRPAEAREVAGTRVRGSIASLPATSVWLYSLTVAAMACAGTGDRDGALELYDLLGPWAALVAQNGCGSSGTVAHHLGLLATVLGRHEEAGAHFADAERINDRMGAPTWQARTRLEWARLLLNGGSPDDMVRARELLGQAHATARELGMRDVEARAGALLDEI